MTEKPAEKAKLVRVRAIKKGYYGEMLRPIGMIFNVSVKPSEKLPSWVEAFDDEAPPAESAALQPDPSSSSQTADDVI